MMLDKLFTPAMANISKAMDLRYERQGLIQSNIANMETPGYTSQDFPFAKVMQSTLQNGALSRTDSKHIALDPVEEGISREYFKEKRPVDLDEEMVKLSENQLMYAIATKIMAKKFTGLKYAIDEAGK